MSNNQNANVTDIKNNSSVVRVVKNKNYTTMSNVHLFNKNLSLKAKGLMSLCLALPDNWKYSVSGLISLSSDGRDSVISAIKSLLNEGFLKIDKERNEKGLFKTVYTFFENPCNNTVSSITENPTPIIRNGKSDTDNPIPIIQYRLSDTENPQLLNTNNQLLISNTNNLSLVNSEEFTPANLFDLYKKICIHFPQPTKLTDERVKKTKLRLKAYPNVDFWETALKNAEKSTFCRKKRFVNFDWIIKNNTNPLKLYEQNYNNEDPKKEVSKNKYSKCY